FFLLLLTATSHISTLSLHDALPISTFVALAATPRAEACCGAAPAAAPLAVAPAYAPAPTVVGYAPAIAAAPVACAAPVVCAAPVDRKSTRLNSSHVAISYAVFCLKK